MPRQFILQITKLCVIKNNYFVVPENYMFLTSWMRIKVNNKLSSFKSN